MQSIARSHRSEAFSSQELLSSGKSVASSSSYKSTKSTHFPQIASAEAPESTHVNSELHDTTGCVRGVNFRVLLILEQHAERDVTVMVCGQIYKS